MIHKGRLRHVARIGAAGPRDHDPRRAGRPRPDARAWIGDREYTAGRATARSSCRSRRRPAARRCCSSPATSRRCAGSSASSRDGTRCTSMCGSIARRSTARPHREGDRTRAADRRGRTGLGRAGRATRRGSVTLTDRNGATSTKAQPLVLSDDDAAVLEWPVGDEHRERSRSRCAARQGARSEQRDEELSRTADFAIGGMHAQLATEALYLRTSAAGWVVYALGKTGEPRARRPVTPGDHPPLVAHAADRGARDRRREDGSSSGTCPARRRITATLGTLTAELAARGRRRSRIRRRSSRPGRRSCSRLRRAATRPRRSARASLVELRGNQPARHVLATLSPLAGAIAIAGLTPGEYQLRAPGLRPVAIRVVEGIEAGAHVVGTTEVAELTRPQPVIAELTATEIRVEGAGPRTRVHVIATPFLATPIRSQPAPRHPPEIRPDRAHAAVYISGRELGDEYPLHARATHARSGSRACCSTRPTLLLNPWARRTTTTDVAHARAGAAFAPPAPGRAPAGYGAPMQSRMAGAGGAAGDVESYDFLGREPVVLANLVPDAEGVVRVPLPELAALRDGDRRRRSGGRDLRMLALPERPLEPRDLRLELALDPATARDAEEGDRAAALGRLARDRRPRDGEGPPPRLDREGARVSDCRCATTRRCANSRSSRAGTSCPTASAASCTRSTRATSCTCSCTSRTARSSTRSCGRTSRTSARRRSSITTCSMPISRAISSPRR